MIITSAVELSNGLVYVGTRHGDCYRFIEKFYTEDALKDSIQGFLNDKLEFLNREQAYYEALSCGQCDKQEYKERISIVSKDTWHPSLASEHLW